MEKRPQWKQEEAQIFLQDSRRVEGQGQDQQEARGSPEGTFSGQGTEALEQLVWDGVLANTKVSHTPGSIPKHSKVPLGLLSRLFFNPTFLSIAACCHSLHSYSVVVVRFPLWAL